MEDFQLSIASHRVCSSANEDHEMRLKEKTEKASKQTLSCVFVVSNWLIDVNLLEKYNRCCNSDFCWLPLRTNTRFSRIQQGSV